MENPSPCPTSWTFIPNSVHDQMKIRIGWRMADPSAILGKVVWQPAWELGKSLPTARPVKCRAAHPISHLFYQTFGLPLAGPLISLHATRGAAGLEGRFLQLPLRRSCMEGHHPIRIVKSDAKIDLQSGSGHGISHLISVSTPRQPHTVDRGGSLIGTTL